MLRSQAVARYTVQIDASSFVFIISLAAVVNGLGIVRWLNGLTEYFRQRDRLDVTFYGVYLAMALFQFLLHVLFWWSLWSIRGTGTINFLSYLYLLLGPVLLFVATATLSPEPDDDRIDLKAHYGNVRVLYATVLILAWLWAILLGPVLRGYVTPTTPFLAGFLAIAIVQRFTGHAVIQAAVALLNWILLLAFIGLFHLQLGGIANAAT